MCTCLSPEPVAEEMSLHEARYGNASPLVGHDSLFNDCKKIAELLKVPALTNSLVLEPSHHNSLVDLDREGPIIKSLVEK